MATNLDIIKILKQEIDLSSVHTVLDLGCGSFHNSPYDYKEHDILFNVFDGKNITAIDIFSENIKWREDYGPKGVYIQADIMGYGFDTFFDVIICHHVLEHLTWDQHDYILKGISKSFLKYAIIGGPVGFHDNSVHVEQTGNPHEKHRIGLRPSDYREYKIFEIEPVFLGIWKR